MHDGVALQNLQDVLETRYAMALRTCTWANLSLSSHIK